MFINPIIASASTNRINDIKYLVFNELHLFFFLSYKLQIAKINISKYSRTSIIIQTPVAVCHFNVKGVQISEFVRISELSDKIHYLAS